MPTNFPNSLDTFVNPSAASQLNASNVALRHSTQHANANDALGAVESKVGINFSNVNTSLDFIVNHLLATQGEHQKAVRRDIVGGAFPTNIIWYGNSAGTIKLLEKSYVYDDKRNIIQVIIKLYDGTPTNTLKRTITDTITRNGPFETSRTRTVT